MYVHVSLSFKNSHSKIHGIASSHGIDYSTDCVFDDGRRQLYLRMTISRAIYIRVGERMALKKHWNRTHGAVFSGRLPLNHCL